MTLLLAGAGSMAVAYARVLDALGAEYLVVGRGAESANSFEEQTGNAPVQGGLGAFLAEKDKELPEAAILALPVSELAGAAIDLMAHGIRRLLVEKPAGLTLDEIRHVAQASEETGAQVCVAYNRRYYASVRAARRMIEEDGGVSSVQFEFTEVQERVLAANAEAQVLENWFFANSSHVIDLAFFLGGIPVELSACKAGALDWHPAGAVFTGSGKTKSGALFSYHADWSSAGRWSVDVCTPKRRLILKPLEGLKVQTKGSFEIEDVTLDDHEDRDFKPGIYLQTKDFLSRSDPGQLLQIQEHAEFALTMRAMVNGERLVSRELQG